MFFDKFKLKKEKLDLVHNYDNGKKRIQCFVVNAHTLEKYQIQVR